MESHTHKCPGSSRFVGDALEGAVCVLYLSFALWSVAGERRLQSAGERTDDKHADRTD